MITYTFKIKTTKKQIQLFEEAFDKGYNQALQLQQTGVIISSGYKQE